MSDDTAVLTPPQSTPARAPAAVYWSDRLNPILVREVQQAVRGRVFYLLVAATLIVSIGIALVIADQAPDEMASPSFGRGAFSAVLMALTPLVLFVVPMQAYRSMRLELRAGIAEQLLLTQLRPWRIVAGKLAAAMVQFFLYLAVLAPVLSMTYLLRGVDVPTIAVCLLVALVLCLATTSLAIAGAAQGAIPMLQGLANVGMAFTLGAATLGVMGAIGDGDLVRGLTWLLRQPQAAQVLTAIIGVLFVVTTVGAMVAATMLAHVHENRSTPFRVLLLVVTGLVFAWVFAFVPAGDRPIAAAIASLFLVGAMSVLGVFFVTEQAALSPRQRRHVPRARWLAVCAAPLLPGRDRGTLFLVGWLALLGAMVWAVGTGTVTPRSFHEVRLVQAFVAVYSVIYLLMTRFVRTRLPETTGANMAARLALPVLLLAMCFVPLLADALLGDGIRGWHVIHMLNPFFTIGWFGTRPVFRPGITGEAWNVLGMLAGFAGVLFALALPALARGVTEVLTAAQRRRQDHAGR